MKFICEVPGSTVDEIFTYNELLDHIEKDNSDIMSDAEQLYMFQHITAHQGTLCYSDKDWKGSKYNVLVEWEARDTTYEPLKAIATDDPVTCAEYAIENKLLDTEGWKQFKRLEKSEKKLKIMINQSNLKAFRRDPFWKFGVRLPRTHAQALELDKANGAAPSGYKKIRYQMIYDVKHDGHHKARLVAGGHLTDPNTESVYSGVVSL
jgi:hypothetical protein